MKNLVFVILFFLWISPSVQQVIAQTKKFKEIAGTVRDEQKLPLAGVTICIKGTNLGTTTNEAGKYKLKIVELDTFTLLFSFIGMKTQEIEYKGKDTINVVLKEIAQELEEVVSTGYERINLRKSTSSIQSIKAKDILCPGLSSIDQMLEGYIPGLIFMQNSGQIGVTPRLSIRGSSTILGSREPVWVINGIVQENPVNIDPKLINDLDFVNLIGNAVSGLNPEDIEQIDILKDASATALYGARAANGVIVITTKKGKTGEPSLSYSFNGIFRKRPYYSDKDVHMMNSKERIDFSRELIEKRIIYPMFSTTWNGYEGAIYKYWQGESSFEEMQQKVGFYESVNTDWFKELMKNSFSCSHTVSLSGGASSINYYTSIGYRNDEGNITGENNKNYSTNIRLSADYGRFTFELGFNGFIARKKYTPEDVEVTKYAYETTRVLPARNPDGSLWYYGRAISSSLNKEYRDYNIINEMENSSRGIRSSGMSVMVNLNYKITSWLTATVVGSYSLNNTTDETWHGENSFYAASMKNIISWGKDESTMPAGGELKYQNTERYAYMIRGQLNNRLFLDKNQMHLFTLSIGGEMSSNQYYGLTQTYRGYLKERGKKMMIASHSRYPAYAAWQYEHEEAMGIWTDKLTNIISAYATCSYFYKAYTLNTNVRMDASNRFGSRTNEKITPIWSFSARWNIKDDILKRLDWISDLALKGSFGYQGNMLESESAKLVLKRGGMNKDFKEYQSFVRSYPNLDLKWEKTSSYNLTLDFGFFNRRVEGSLSYFYKHSRNIFLNKSISSINGVNFWVVNSGTLENRGTELGLDITLIDARQKSPNGFRWRISPRFGEVTNKIGGKKDKDKTDEINYNNLLKGQAKIEGRPINSFYSYKYQGLNSENGIPMFYGSERYQYIGNNRIDLKEKYFSMNLLDILKDFMIYSGNRVPKWQGGISHYISWKRFALSCNMVYSLENKIRLLKMYPDVNSDYATIAPQPMANVRKEFLKRWQKSGDEMNTNIPGIVSGSDFEKTLNNYMWWKSFTNKGNELVSLGENLWTMYDHSDLRTVSGNFLKIQSLNIRYLFPNRTCKQLHVKSAYVALSGTNLYTFCHKRLKGQDPATQDGVAPTINMSLRPTYSLSLNISF